MGDASALTIGSDAAPGDMADLEEIAAQTTTAINVGTRQQNGRIGWRCLSPNITRSKVAREKPAIVKAVKAKPAQNLQIIPPPAASIPIPGRVIAVFDDYTGMQHALRARTDELGFTRETLDFLSGCQSGYSGKLLGRKMVKRFGKQSLGPVLGAVGTQLALVEDSAEIEKLKAVAAALSALMTVAALGITRAEFERIAHLAVRPHKVGIGAIGDTLAATGCRLALIEDEKQTAKMTSRAAAMRRNTRNVVRHLGERHVCSG